MSAETEVKQPDFYTNLVFRPVAVGTDIKDDTVSYTVDSISAEPGAKATAAWPVPVNCCRAEFCARMSTPEGVLMLKAGAVLESSLILVLRDLAKVLDDQLLEVETRTKAS